MNTKLFIKQMVGQLLVIGLLMPFGPSCTSAGPHLSFVSDPAGGAAGSPTITTINTRTSSTTLSSSEKYQGWLSVATSSFPGSGGFLESKNYQASDAMLELGVVQVHEAVK